MLYLTFNPYKRTFCGFDMDFVLDCFSVFFCFLKVTVIWIFSSKFLMKLKKHIYQMFGLFLQTSCFPIEFEFSVTFHFV